MEYIFNRVKFARSLALSDNEGGLLCLCLMWKGLLCMEASHEGKLECIEVKETDGITSIDCK